MRSKYTSRNRPPSWPFNGAEDVVICLPSRRCFWCCCALVILILEFSQTIVRLVSLAVVLLMTVIARNGINCLFWVTFQLTLPQIQAIRSAIPWIYGTVVKVVIKFSLSAFVRGYVTRFTKLWGNHQSSYSPIKHRIRTFVHFPFGHRTHDIMCSSFAKPMLHGYGR